MVGIVAYGAYVPRLRLNRQSVYDANKWFAAGLRGLVQLRSWGWMLVAGAGGQAVVRRAFWRQDPAWHTPVRRPCSR